MAENREITLFSEPEELIAWAEVYDKQINPSIEDAALLLNYMEGHDYAIGMDAEGKMYRQDMAEENGEIEPFPIDDVIDKVCEWNYDLILHAEAKKDDPKDFQEYCEFQEKYDSLKADERVLDRLFDKTSHAKEIDAVATALVEAFISNLEGKHLKRALDYVMNPDKTQDGRLVGAINCQVDTAFEQMKETKRNFGKIDKRQGYHIILSFKENEVNPDTAFEITQKFVEEYLGKSYEAVFVVHDNTAHVHSHIVFNSVSFVDGKKYRYEKGDWAKYIQPITNRLCQEYGLSIIDVDDEKKERQHESYKEWSEYREGNFVWSDMIKRDLDACILQAKDYEEFLELLSEKGYQIKQGKHLAIKPQGMTRFRRCKSLGDMYCEEAIRDRIVKEDIAFYKSKQDIPKVSIVKCRVKRYRRAGLSGLQKKHYAKLYRVGKLKKRPYSQVWKYREDIRKMHKLQEQYLFLARHNIHSAEELVGTIASLTDKKKETSAEKSRIYKARERSMELFTAADEMENLKPAEQSYRLGDIFFEDEHRKWVALEQELQAQGYSLEEVQALRRHYKEEYSEVCAREKVVCRELNTGKAILNSMIPDSISDGRKTEYNREIIRDRKEQPVR